MTLDEVYKEIVSDLKKHSTDDAKKALQRAVPNVSNAYGLRMPIINDFARNYRVFSFPLATKLWQSGVYDERMLAAKIIGFNCAKNPALTIELVRKFSSDVDNWALCDTLCSEGVRRIVKKNGDDVMNLAKSFLSDEEMWVRRMGIVLLIHFAKVPERKAEVLQLIKPLLTDKEHYIKKAITWIMRYLNKH